MKRVIGIALAAVALSARAGAQESLLPSAAWGFGPIISGWHFSAPVPQAATGVSVQDIAEVAFPIRVRTLMFGGRWSFDISAAYAVGAIHIAKADGQSQGSGDGGGDDVKMISGPTDLKLRLNGPIIGQSTALTIGVNVPTGQTKLDADQTAALQAIGAPAFRMPVAAYGTGAGATLGIVRAFDLGDWAYALGASVEQRTEYSPIAIALAGSSSETRVTPGTAIHLSFGTDRTIGQARWSTLVVGDVFSKDKVKLVASSGDGSTTDYQLGPQVTATSRYEFGSPAWREGAFNVALRYRSPFSDASGAKVTGSGATYAEASIGGVRGGARGTGFVIGADARWQSGMTFTDAFVGAAATVTGVSIGFDAPMGGSAFRFVIHPQYGSFDTGTTKFTGLGGTIAFSFAAQREAR